MDDDNEICTFYIYPRETEKVNVIFQEWQVVCVYSKYSLVMSASNRQTWQNSMRKIDTNELVRLYYEACYLT